MSAETVKIIVLELIAFSSPCFYTFDRGCHGECDQLLSMHGDAGMGFEEDAIVGQENIITLAGDDVFVFRAMHGNGLSLQ